MRNSSLVVINMNLEDSESYDLLFKIILIGDAGVGKTSIVQRYKSGVWVESQASTIGVDFCMKSCTVKGKRVKLQVWDTAGQERFRTITQSYYRSAHAVVCAFDLSERKSFENIDKWMEDVSKYCNANVIIILVGNKSDLIESRKVSKEEAIQLGSCYEIIEYTETSAKDNKNIETSFQRLASALVESCTASKLYDDNTNSTSFSLGYGYKSKPVGSACSGC